MGSNAGAGTLDFLRNSQQVSYLWFSFINLKVGFFMYTNLPEVFKAICSLFQFQALRAMVQANPQILQVFFIECFLVLVVSLINLITYVNIDYYWHSSLLQPMLQELGKQNPHLMRLIQEHQADFLRLINEPVEGEGWDDYYALALAFVYFYSWIHMMLIYILMYNQEPTRSGTFRYATGCDCHTWGAWGHWTCKFVGSCFLSAL